MRYGVVVTTGDPGTIVELAVRAEDTGWGSQVGEFGRGERVRTDTTSPVLLIPVTNVPSHVHRASDTA